LSSANYSQNQNKSILLPNYSSYNGLTNPLIYTQSLNIQTPKITVFPPRIFRTEISYLLGYTVRMTIRSSSQTAKLRASYTINDVISNQFIRVPFLKRYSFIKPKKKR